MRMRYVAAFVLQLKRLYCHLVGHRMTKERKGDLIYTGCARCRQLFNIDRLVFTRRRETTFGDIERKMAANSPEGYSFVSCNWKKRMAKFVSPSGNLKFVAF